MACYSEVLQRDPAYAPAWRGLGDARREAGDPSQASACYQEAIRLQPQDADAHSGLGACLRELGRKPEAQVGVRGSAAGARLPKALHGLARARACRVPKRTVPTAAPALLSTPQAEFEAAVRLRPKCALALGNLAGAYYEQVCRVHFVTASLRSRIDMCTRLAGDAVGCRSPDAQATMQRHPATLQGKLEEAVACYRRAIAVQPQFPEAYNNREC